MLIRVPCFIVLFFSLEFCSFKSSHSALQYSLVQTVMQNDTLLLKSTIGFFVSFSNGTYLEYEVIEKRNSEVGANRISENIQKSFDTTSIYYVDFINQRYLKLDTSLINIRVLEQGRLSNKKTGIVYNESLEPNSSIGEPFIEYDTVVNNVNTRCYEKTEYSDIEQDTLKTKYYFFKSSKIPTILDYLTGKSVGDEFSLFRLELSYKKRRYVHRISVDNLEVLDNKDIFKYKGIREVAGDTTL